jgi:aminopeptidase-like protein
MSDQQMYEWAADLFPICRSLTGNGVRETLRYMQKQLPGLQIHEVPAGTKVFDWTIPPEWNVRDAYIATLDGERIIDFKENNLHLMGYSEPVDEMITLEALMPHLYSLAHQPTAIPYVTSYYERNWGFSLSENQREVLPEGPFRVKIDSDLDENGSLTYADFVIPGTNTSEILFSTYICHPSMANNELSGPVVLLALAQWLSSLTNLKYTYRFCFVPETIGALTYLSRHIEDLKMNVVAGWQVTCVGDTRNFSFLPTRNGNTLTDKVSKKVLEMESIHYVEYSFLDRGSDERQWNAPGIDLPIASIMRTKYGEYPEYHTSLDDMSVISLEGLIGSLEVYKACVRELENGIRPKAVNLGEPQLGKRGLYPNTSIKDSYANVFNLVNILAYSDGINDLEDLNKLTNVPLDEIQSILKALYEHGLVK